MVVNLTLFVRFYDYVMVVTYLSISDAAWTESTILATFLVGSTFYHWYLLSDIE